MDVNSIVEKYIKLRDRKAEKKKAYEADVETIDNLLTKVEGVMLRYFEEHGMESIRTAAGTVYRGTRTSCTVASREEFFSWLKESGEWDLLDVRAAKANVETFVKENGDLPPGLNWSAVPTVGVRRGK